jgi:hypothetical protein
MCAETLNCLLIVPRPSVDDLNLAAESLRLRRATGRQRCRR